MVRRNLFQPPAPPSEVLGDTAAGEARGRFPSTGAMSGVRSTLRDLSSNAVREIDFGLIDDSGPKDRLDFAAEDVSGLVESIRQHGQQVPIMVRPMDEHGRYPIVFGRRRLKALAHLGLPARALVRSLTDEQAVLAQAHENTGRLDPSFIEKALFVAELTDAGYEHSIIREALVIDGPMLSRMSKVSRIIPRDVAQLIGPAHGVGRRRWEELADLVSKADLDLTQMAQGLEASFSKRTSDARFTLLMRTAENMAGQTGGRGEGRAVRSVTLPDGTQLAEIRESARAVTISVSATSAPEFTQWLRDNADQQIARLHEIWKSETRPE